MTQQTEILAALTLMLGSYGLALVAVNGTSSPAPLTVARVHFEQNATDGDVEVVFQVKAGDEGLSKLAVVSPEGRIVVDFTSPDASTLGMRQFRFESPEPKDVKSLIAAFPEGVYTFAGTTPSGNKFEGKSRLSHKLPATSSFIQPRAAARNVNIKNLEITWMPVRDVAAYIVYIEQDELDVNLTAKLPGSVTTFSVPDGFLLHGKEYTLGIGTITGEGNTSFIETTFATAGKN